MVHKAFFPGTFDPFTNGHLDLVRRARKVFDELVIGIYDTNGKSHMFTAEERLEMLREGVADMEGVAVRRYTGLTVNLAREVGAQFILRGLRIGSDFEYERGMALTNRELDGEIDTICLMSALEYQFLSSSRVREVHSLGGDVSTMVPEVVLKAFRKKAGKG